MSEFEFIVKLKRKMNLEAVYCSRPKIIGITYTDGFGCKEPEKLRYFKEPKRTSYPLDLKKGFESYQFRYESYYKENLMKLENFLMENESFDMGEESDTTNICSTRGLLYRIMTIPYKIDMPGPNNSDLNIFGTKFHNNIYLVYRDNQSHSRNSPNDTYHFKFEQYCFTDSPSSEPDTDVPIDENKQTTCFYRTQLGDLNIFYSGEIDGIISEEEIKNVTNVDLLNDCRFIYTKLGNHKNWRKSFKMLNWWSQAYLANASNIFVGIKEEGQVNEPGELVAVRDLVKDQKWKPNVCTVFLHSVLNIVRNKMSGVNCPYTVYEFRYDIKTERLEYRIHEGKTKNSFLNEKFVNYLQKKQKK